MSLKRKSVFVSVVGAALLIGLIAAGSAAVRTAGPRDNFGFSQAVQAKINRLNAQLDACLLAHGAQRVSLGKGWTYTDPGGQPSAACAGVQERVNSYADSDEYRQAVAAVLPAVQAYSDCLQQQGVPQASHGAPSATERGARVDAVLACGGRAEDAVAGG